MPAQAQRFTPRRFVAAFDGGGIRGILTAAVLKAVAEGLGEDHPLHKVFDLISGTSTGGILACGLYAGKSPSALLDLYVKNGTAIFGRSPWQYVRSGWGRLGPASKYRADALREALVEVLGGQWLGRRLTRTRLLVPSYCIRLPCPMDMDKDGIQECASAFFFKSEDARLDGGVSDFTLVDVGLATSAAPTFFPAHHAFNALGQSYLFVDGGTFANNPAMCAWAEARKYWALDPLTLVSIGTGSRVRSISGSGDWGPPRWLPHIFSVFMDGAADSVSYQAGKLLGQDFIRCETALVGVDDAFDDAGRPNIIRLVGLGERFAEIHAPRILDALRGK